MDVGARIRHLREKQGWTTNYLANSCGVSQSFLRSVELGEKGISVEYLSLICDTLGISLKDFFDVPTETDGLGDVLCRKIRALNVQQQAALSAFLDTIV